MTARPEAREPNTDALKEAAAHAWDNCCLLAIARIRAYEGQGAEDAIRELEHMFGTGPELYAP